MLEVIEILLFFYLLDVDHWDCTKGLGQLVQWWLVHQYRLYYSYTKYRMEKFNQDWWGLRMGFERGILEIYILGGNLEEWF